MLLAACSIYDERLLESTGGRGSGAGGSAAPAGTSTSGNGNAEPRAGAGPSGAGHGGATPEAGGPDAGSPGAGSAGSAGEGSGGESGSGGEPDVVADGLIDDFENGDHRIEAIAGRKGDWFVAHDGSPGGAMLPADFSDLAQELEAHDPRAALSSFALHTTGSGFSSHADSADDWGALVGCNLNQVVTTKKPYDARAYCGVRFVARGSFTDEDGSEPLHVRISDQWTIPDAGQCGADWPCNAHAGKAFILPEVDAWTAFEVPFTDFQHDIVPEHPALDLATLYSVEFTFQGQGQFDVWIDDLAFVACADP